MREIGTAHLVEIMDDYDLLLYTISNMVLMKKHIR